MLYVGYEFEKNSIVLRTTVYGCFYSGEPVDKFQKYFAQVRFVKFFIKTVVIKVEEVTTYSQLHVISFTP